MNQKIAFLYKSGGWKNPFSGQDQKESSKHIGLLFGKAAKNTSNCIGKVEDNGYIRIGKMEMLC